MTDSKFRRKNQGRNVFVYPNDDIIMECKMNGRKPSAMGANNKRKPAKSNAFQWLNIPLDNEDRVICSENTDDLSILAANLIALVGYGYDVSVKYNAERGSYSCSIYRSCDDPNDGNIGLSSFAADVRLSIVVTLYKLESLCGGDIIEYANGHPSDKQKQSFG
jgi:hypothetical protein